MNRVSLAVFVSAMVYATGAVTAPLPPASLAATTDAGPLLLLPVKHHGHHWHWRYRAGRWSGYPLYYGTAPEVGVADPPSLGYAPPPISPNQAPAQTPSAPAAPPAAGSTERGGQAPTTRPSIEWVNPDRGAR